MTDIIKWLSEHKYILKKVDITNNYYRCRQVEPSYLKNKGYTHYINKFIDNKKIILVIAYK